VKRVDEVTSCARCEERATGFMYPARVNGRTEWCCYGCTFGIVDLTREES
jgi:hypothetical protein